MLFSLYFISMFAIIRIGSLKYKPHMPCIELNPFQDKSGSVREFTPPKHFPYSLNQRCPTRCWRSPHLWRINLYSQTKSVVFNGKVWIKLIISYFWSIYNESHSPHLNGHSSYVASGEWVGQRCSKHSAFSIIILHLHKPLTDKLLS